MRKTIYQQPKLKTAKITASLGFAQSGGVLKDAGKNSNFGLISGGTDDEFGG